MKLYSLGDGGFNAPCLLLRFRGIGILFDVTLDSLPLLGFAPRLATYSHQRATYYAGQQNPYSTNDISIASEISSSKRQRIGSNASKVIVGGPGIGVCLSEVAGGVTVVATAAPHWGVPCMELVDMSNVHVVVASNPHGLLGLPYLTERSSFAGIILATEPVLVMARHLMLELCSLLHDTPGPPDVNSWRHPSLANFLPASLSDTSRLRALYTKDSVIRALARVKIVAFKERTSLHGVVDVAAASSGYCLGGSNWIVSTCFDRIAFIGPSSSPSLPASLHHAAPLDLTPLVGADIAIIASMATAGSDNPETMLGELCGNVVSTLQRGGNVLLPMNVFGQAWDIIETLHAHLRNTAGDTAVGTTPIFLIGSRAKAALAFADIASEWMDAVRSERAMLPEPPFGFANLSTSGPSGPQRLYTFSSHADPALATAYREPCIVIASHPSLRLGAAAHFLRLWKGNARNSAILTDPLYLSGGNDGRVGSSLRELLAPFEPMALRVCVCPLDVRLSNSDASAVLREVAPASVVLPHSVPVIGDALRLPDGASYDRYGRLDTVVLKHVRTTERAVLSDELAESLKPYKMPGNKLGKKARATAVVAALTRSNNVLRIGRPTIAMVHTQPAATRPPRALWGKLDAHDILDRLTKSCASTVCVDTSVPIDDNNTEGVLVLRVTDNEGNGGVAEITITSSATHIATNDAGEGLRQTIRALLLEYISEF